jgi:pilus assembly protein CpaF
VSADAVVYPGLRARVRERFVADVGRDGERPVRARLADLLHDEAPLLGSDRFDAALHALLDDVVGLGPLEPLLADPAVTEIMVNGPGRLFVERRGRLTALACDLDADAIRRLVERVLAPLGLRIDRSAPIVDARLPDGTRVHVAIPPIAVDGPYLTIRRPSGVALGLDAFGLPPGPLAFLRWIVDAGWNVLVSGGTSTGKTTFVAALAALAAGTADGCAAERIVTIEETAELRISGPHVVRLEARPANAEGAGEVDVRTLVRSALRMRPDRIVLGEVRGGEALDLVQALSTGHDGSLGTVHANDPAGALARVEALALVGAPSMPRESLRVMLAASIDAVVHLRRAADGRREVAAIAEVVAPVDPATHPVGTRPLFTHFATGWTLGTPPGRAPRRSATSPLSPGWFR